MKLLITSIFILFCSVSNAQSWVLSKADTTKFIIEDTLKRVSAQSGWDTSEWSEIAPELAWSKDKWFKRKFKQYRFGKTSGYRQKRVATVEYILEQPKKSTYEQLIDSALK